VLTRMDERVMRAPFASLDRRLRSSAWSAWCVLARDQTGDLVLDQFACVACRSAMTRLAVSTV
jgi:hypothetical protein